MKLTRYIQGPLRICSKHFCDPLTFPLVPPIGQSFNLHWNILNANIYLMDLHKMQYRLW